MTYVTLDTKFFIHVFIGFAITSLMLTAVLIYEVNRVYETNGKLWQKIKKHSSVDDLWSLDPELMDGLALMRGRRSEGGSGYVILTQLTFNDSCFGFLWSKFHMEKIVKYTVQVSSVNDPFMAPIEAVIGGLTTEYSLCGLNVSSAYWVNLTAHGQNAGASESAFGIMWTTHQVPPPPSAINVLDVTERTITITIPEIVLTKGPLSGVEVRIIMRAKVPLPESKENPWTNVLSREKRSAESAGQPSMMIRTVELPTYLFSPRNARLGGMVDDVHKFNENDTAEIRASPSSDLGNTSRVGSYVVIGLKTAKRKNSSNEVTTLLSTNYDDANTAADDVKNFPTVSAGDSVEESQPNPITHGDQNRVQAMAEFEDLENDVGWNDSSVNDVIQTILQAWWRNRQINPDSNLTADLNVNMTSLLTDWLVDDLVNTFNRPTPHDQASGESFSHLEFDSAPELDANQILALFKVNLTSDLLYPYFDRCAKILVFALAYDDEEWPEDDANASKTGDADRTTNVTLLTHAVDATDESLTDKGNKSSDSVAGKNQERRSKSDHERTANENANMETILKDYGSTGPRLVDSERDIQGILKDSVKSRGKRSISSGSRHQRLRFIENRDVLQVDPYQTINIVYTQGRQPLLVKTGFGFFVTDHYGVRHPYFNNTKLGRILLRMTRFQEAYDFLLLGQPLLMNMTHLSEKDFITIKKRMDKLMNTNSKRRDTIFQHMFEDFLWLRDNNNRVYRRSIPDSAKLGLPPGYTVAQFTDGQSRNITLGSREEYGSVPNPPLEMSTEYEIVLAVMSTVADVTKHAWTSVNVTTKPEVPRAVSPIFVILSGAFLTICLFILLLSCFVLWCSKRPRKLANQDDRFDDLRLEVPPDFISRPASPLIVSPKRPEPVSPYYPMYPSPPPYPAYPPAQPPGYWAMPLPSPPVPSERSEGEEEERTDRTKKRKKKKKKREADDQSDEEAALPNYIRKVHKPEAHWNRIYDPTGKRYLVDKRANVRDGGRVGLNDRNNISDDDEAETAKGITFRDEFALLTDGLNVSFNALTDFSRFPHIPLCESTRVFLSPDVSSDNTFIHANYIDGCIRGGVSYIAAMSPFNDETVLDFWRLIYQRKIETIVMMTNVLEGGIMKCAEYWPPCSETVRTLGHFLIQTVSSRSYADYVIRKMKVKSQSSADCLEVKQFQYTAWPPQGTPFSPVTLLDMRYWIRRHHEETKSSKILVHCGTGVSRTAVFVAIDALIDQYEQEGGVNVFKYVSQMRRSRPMMVRSLDQYIFIYTALQDEFEAGDTNIDLEEGIQNAMVSLSQVNPNTGQTYLEDQFDLLNYFTLDFLAEDVNIPRLLDNRYSKTSAVTKRRSSVKPIFVDGYRNRIQFVLLDTPCDEEIEDFWRFVCLNNIVSIVELGKNKRASPIKKSDRQDDNSKKRTAMELTGKYRADTITSKRYDVTLVRDILLEEMTGSGRVEKRKIRHFSIPSRHIVCGGRRKSRPGKKHRKRKEKRKKVRYRKTRNEPQEYHNNYMSSRCAEKSAEEHAYVTHAMSDRKTRVLTPMNDGGCSAQYVREGNLYTKEIGNIPNNRIASHKNRADRQDARSDHRGKCFTQAVAAAKSDRNDGVTFFVLKDGRLVRTCRNDNKSSIYIDRHAKHFVSNSQMRSKIEQHYSRNQLLKYPGKYKQRHTSAVMQKRYKAIEENLGTSGSVCKRLTSKSSLRRSASASQSRKVARHRTRSSSSTKQQSIKSLHGQNHEHLLKYRSRALSSGHRPIPRARCSPPQRKSSNPLLDKLKLRYMKTTNSSTNNRNRYIHNLSKLKTFLHPRRLNVTKLANFLKNPGQQLTELLPQSTSTKPQRPFQVRQQINEVHPEKVDTCNSAFTTVMPIPGSQSVCSGEVAASNDITTLLVPPTNVPPVSKKIKDPYHKPSRNSRKPASLEANGLTSERFQETCSLENIGLRKRFAPCARSTSTSSDGDSSSQYISPSSLEEDSVIIVSFDTSSAPDDRKKNTSLSKDENESATKAPKRPNREKRKKKAKHKNFDQEKVCKKALKPNQLLDLNEMIWRWQSSPHSDTRQNPAQGPVLIHCPPGKGDASLLCACAQVCEQIQEDQEVDVYHVVKHLRRKCPSAVGSFDEFDFLHRVLFHYVTEYMDEVALSDRWKNRHREEQVHRSVIESSHLVRRKHTEPYMSPSSTPDNTTLNRASSHQTQQHYIQDDLSIVDEPIVPFQKRTQQQTIPSLSPRSSLAIDLSTQPKLQRCGLSVCGKVTPTDEDISSAKELGELNICSVQESDIGVIDTCSVQESDGSKFSRENGSENCADNTDMDVISMQ